MEQWKKAVKLGIPLQQKHWTSLSKLMSSYNAAVRPFSPESMQVNATFAGAASEHVCRNSKSVPVCPVASHLGAEGRGVIGVRRGSLQAAAKRRRVDALGTMPSFPYAPSPYTPQPGLGAASFSSLTCHPVTLE